MRALALFLLPLALMADPLPLLTITLVDGTQTPTFLFRTYADSMLIGRIEIDYGAYESLVELTVNGGNVAATACNTICDYENVALILAAHSNYTVSFSQPVDAATMFGVYYHDRATGNAYNYPGTVEWVGVPEPSMWPLVLFGIVAILALCWVGKNA